MKTYKYAADGMVQQFDEDGICRISGLRSAFPDDITIEPADPIPPQPIIVSPRQIRQALTASNLRSQVESAVSSGDQDLKDWWEFSTQIESNHPQVIERATALNISEEQLTNLFELAKSL
jgi:hypothetical protein